jgi:hypothetical protein
VDEPDRDGVQEVELLAAASFRNHQARVLEHAEMLHDAEARHRQAPLEGGQALAVGLEELVEQAPSGRVGQRPEDLVHGASYVT